MPVYTPPALITLDDLIDLVSRNMDDFWIGALLEDPSSRSIFEGLIAPLLRVQTAGDINFLDGCFIQTAQGPEFSQTTVRITRPEGGAFTLPTTFQFQDQFQNVWVPSAPFPISASLVPQTLNVPIRSVRTGYWLNSFEPLTFVAVDEFEDADMVVIAGDQPAIDGRTGFLDEHGSERGYLRALGEPDEPIPGNNGNYRNRLSQVPDRVTPLALTLAVISTFTASEETKHLATWIDVYGLRMLMEPFRDSSQDDLQGLLGAESGPAYWGSGNPSQDWFDGFFWDDPRVEYRDFADFSAHLDIPIPSLPELVTSLQGFWSEDAPSPDRTYLGDEPISSVLLTGFPRETWLDVETITSTIGAYSSIIRDMNAFRPACVNVRGLIGEPLHFVRGTKFSRSLTAGNWRTETESVLPADLLKSLSVFDGKDTFARSSIGAGPGSGVTSSDLHFGLNPMTEAVTPHPETLAVGAVRVSLRAWVRMVSNAIGTPPVAQFVFQYSGSGIARVGPIYTITSTAWQLIEIHMEVRPSVLGAGAWTVADLVGSLRVGIANVHTALAATDFLDVSAIYAEVVLDLG